MRSAVWRDWCLVAINMIAKRMDTDTDRILALKEMTKNFITSQAFMQPQDAEEVQQ